MWNRVLFWSGVAVCSIGSMPIFICFICVILDKNIEGNIYFFCNMTVIGALTVGSLMMLIAKRFEKESQTILPDESFQHPLRKGKKEMKIPYGPQKILRQMQGQKPNKTHKKV